MPTSSKKSKGLTFTILSLPDENVAVGSFAVDDGRTVDEYEFMELEVHYGRGFRVKKTSGKDNSEFGHYDVNIDGEYTQCCCWGWCRWNNCRHVEFLKGLIRDGKI